MFLTEKSEVTCFHYRNNPVSTSAPATPSPKSQMVHAAGCFRTLDITAPNTAKKITEHYNTAQKRPSRKFIQWT